MKLRVTWGLRAKRYEERLKLGIAGSIAKDCWEEKRRYNCEDSYGEERDRYLNRIGWEADVEERAEWSKEEIEKWIIERERSILKKEEEERIRNTRYNPRYKEIEVTEGCPRYLKAESLEEVGKGDEIRALVKLRCGNLENLNKYWLEEKSREYVFCGMKEDSTEHYVRESGKTKEWFRGLGEEEGEILKRIWGEDLNRDKGRFIKRLWKEREKRIKIKEKERTKEAGREPAA